MPKTDAEIFDAALLASVEVVEDPRIAELEAKVSDLEARCAAMAGALETAKDAGVYLCGAVSNKRMKNEAFTKFTAALEEIGAALAAYRGDE